MLRSRSALLAALAFAIPLITAADTPPPTNIRPATM